MKNDIEKLILDAIAEDGIPKTFQEISNMVNIPVRQTRRILDDLIHSDKVIRNTGKSHIYYSLPLKMEIENGTLNLDDYYREIQKSTLSNYASFMDETNLKLEEIKKVNQEAVARTRRIYTDIITLMGIFVAVFALIVINVEAIQGAISATDCIWISFGKLLLLNFPLVLAIAALMFLIKYFLLKPLCENKDKTCAKEVVEDDEQETH